MKSLSTIALCLTLLAPAWVAAEDKKDDVAEKLIGNWELTKADAEGAPIGAIVTFAKGGKLTVTAKVNDAEMKFEGTYKIEDGKLVTEIKVGDMTHSDTDTIKKLTADEMELVNKDGKGTTLKRKK